jgi:hypothetical protein
MCPYGFDLPGMLRVEFQLWSSFHIKVGVRPREGRTRVFTANIFLLSCLQAVSGGNSSHKIS